MALFLGAMKDAYRLGPSPPLTQRHLRDVGQHSPKAGF